MGVFVGLDCGGSNSRVMAVDAEGTVVFQGRSGAANLVATPEHRLRRNLAAACEGCPPASVVCGCFAGLLGSEQRATAIALLRPLFPGAEVRAEPDYAAALHASEPGTDLCVVAGTGSLVCSRHGGETVKSGGRGYLLGDVGSGFHYGRAALLQFLDEPKASSAALRKEIVRLFGTTNEAELVAAVYRGGTPATALSKLLKAFASDLKAGEAYATEAVERHSRDLARVVEAHVDRYFGDRTELQVSLAGGVWKAGAAFGEVFARQLGAVLPDRRLTLVRIAQPPLAGAVALAREIRHGN